MPAAAAASFPRRARTLGFSGQSKVAQDSLKSFEGTAKKNFEAFDALLQTANVSQLNVQQEEIVKSTQEKVFVFSNRMYQFRELFYVFEIYFI